MTNNDAAPARDGNPYANLSLHNGKPRRMGGTMPAATGPVDSVYTNLRITVDKQATQCYRLLGSARVFTFYPCQLNALLKPLVGDLRPEDDMKVNWRVTWFADAKQHKIITKIVDTTTGEVLAQSDTQPALIETTIDENTGQLTTEAKSGSPFGRLGLPAETIEKARIKGEELRAEREKKEAEMAPKTNSEAIAEFNAANEPDAAPWTKTPGLLTKFWETVFADNGVFSKEEDAARKAVIEDLGTNPESWPVLDECYTRAGAAITHMRESASSNGNKTEQSKAPAKAAENVPAATPIPETPPTPVSDEKTPVAMGNILGMSEAGFSITFKWVDGDGSEQQFTMREPTWQEGLKQLPLFHAQLRSMGFMPMAEYQKAHPAPVAPTAQTAAPAPTVTPSGVAPAPVAAVAPAASDGGSYAIVEVKKFQDEGKTEYHLFEAGRDKPAMKLRVKGDQDKLAQYIDLNQMVVGQRYALSLIAEWKNSANVGRDGNPFRNLKALHKAAA